jgi:cell division protein FtsW (lipid II flippase)
LERVTLRISVAVLAVLCAAASVAFGAIYLMSAGAPGSYVRINAAALLVGAIVTAAVRRVPVHDQRFAGVATVAVGLLLLATALWGVHIEGASRWLRIAGISMQPSLVLQPMAMVYFARNRDWISSIGLAIVSAALGLQPDRAMAGTLAAGLAALWVHRSEPPVTVALVAALCGLAATMLSADAVAPVAFVEQVVQSAFRFHVLSGVAIVAGFVTMLVPAAAVFGAPTEGRHVFAVFGMTWMTMILFAMIGNYPTPLVGYGSSAILGYCLSAAALPERYQASSKPEARTTG